MIKLLISGEDIDSVWAGFLEGGGAIAVILICSQRQYFELYYQTQKITKPKNEEQSFAIPFVFGVLFAIAIQFCRLTSSC